MKKTLLVSLLVFSLAALLVVGGTMAWFTDDKTIDNKFTAGTVSIEINEHDFEDIINWNPGDTTDKDVSVKSTGSKGTYVRVKLTPVWGTIAGGVFTEDTTLSVTNITLNTINSDKWIESGGYYYYYKIMNQGEETELLLDSVTIAGPGTGNEYQGKTLKVNVAAEAVQASHEAYKDAWGITSLPTGVEAWTE
ncbi:BsaA family SipW-dependent biofilm matrix protein [Tepidanaerobacter sp. EBM-38]|uniref:BsaA family SipW-dependent biofilm matrix protein n=1 Tax=Tepidanaerobacter sp. EBM-38 TaxID=1918496 RepID=UPI000AF729F4|nr:BsaA family SipW-dependent biofilm matrix protein [Tepidanaerobacter sp. EBM-38]